MEVARALMNPGNGQVPIQLLNTWSDPIELSRESTIAVLEPVSPEQHQESITT